MRPSQSKPPQSRSIHGRLAHCLPNIIERFTPNISQGRVQNAKKKDEHGLLEEKSSQKEN